MPAIPYLSRVGLNLIQYVSLDLGIEWPLDVARPVLWLWGNYRRICIIISNFVPLLFRTKCVAAFREKEGYDNDE